MKILFYDIKEFELDYLLSNVSNNTEPYFFKYPLNSRTYVDEKYADCEALCVFVSSQLKQDTLSRFKNLKFIFLRCSGYSNVDLKYCKKHNIKIFNVPSYASSTVGEYAFGLILALSRKIIKAQNDLKEGEINHDELTGFELNNKTIGIIGMGHIGKKIAQIALGFNMNVLAYDIEKTEEYNFVELDELYKNSDIIVLSCPLNINTKGMIKQSVFNKMKKNAILINVARGEIVDTKALTNALVKKQIQGCALDVVECEEKMCNLWDFCINSDKCEDCLKKFLFIQKLKTMDNVIITPHIAYNTNEAIREILDTTMQNIQSSFVNNATKNLIML